MAESLAAEFDVMLTKILQDLLEQANAAPDQPAQKMLGGGLGLHLRKDGGSVVFTIYRINVPPSAKEWNTAIAFWPWQLGALNWSNSGVTKDGRYYKQARIPLQMEQ